MLAEVVAIHLICAGGGAHAVQRTTTASSVNNMANPVIISSTSHVGYDDEVAVQIEGGEGKIRVPDGVKPRIRSGESPDAYVGQEHGGHFLSPFCL